MTEDRAQAIRDIRRREGRWYQPSAKDVDYLLERVTKLDAMLTVSEDANAALEERVTALEKVAEAARIMGKFDYTYVLAGRPDTGRDQFQRPDLRLPGIDGCSPSRTGGTEMTPETNKDDLNEMRRDHDEAGEGFIPTADAVPGTDVNHCRICGWHFDLHVLLAVRGVSQ